MKKKIEYSKEQKLLLKAIGQAVEEINLARWYFESVDDPRLVDFAIYKEAAAKAKYGYLIYEAKQKGLEVRYSSFLMTENQVG
ncbi:MAG: DUF2508 family protein [Solirubrobacterales bacterium]